ncbi:hypothetical protein [Photobacterium sp. DNB22_13_2]
MKFIFIAEKVINLKNGKSIYVTMPDAEIKYIKQSLRSPEIYHSFTLKMNSASFITQMWKRDIIL